MRDVGRDDHAGDVLDAGRQRRREDHEGRVDAVLREHGTEGNVVVGRLGAEREVDRVGHERAGRQRRGEVCPRVAADLGELEAGLRQRRLRERQGAMGVAQHRDPGAGRQWLRLEDSGDVEEVGQLAHRDDAGLTEQGVDRAIGIATTRLHRDDRLRPRHPPSDAS